MLTIYSVIGEKGVPGGFGTFYDDYYPRAAKALKAEYPAIDIQTACELAQDAMVSMYHARREDIDEMNDRDRRAYLMTAARRKARNFLASKAREGPWPDGITEPSYDNQTEILHAIQIRDDLSLLRPELREVVALRYFADLTISQIAEITGVNKDTVKSRLRIARKHLRHWIPADSNRRNRKGTNP